MLLKRLGAKLKQPQLQQEQQLDRLFLDEKD
jgi:hypothetical protein